MAAASPNVTIMIKIMEEYGRTQRGSQTSSLLLELSCAAPCQRLSNCWRHLYYLTAGTNPVMPRVICWVIIMQIDSGTALAGLDYSASSLLVIHGTPAGAK